MDNTSLINEAIGAIILTLALTLPFVIREIAATIKHNKEMKKRRLSR